MKYLSRILWLVALALAGTNCLSFKVTIPDDPFYRLEYAVILRQVDRNSDFSKPIANDEISTKDKTAFALIKVCGIDRPLKAQWFWYDPTGKLTKRSKSVDINVKNKYLEYFVAWDSLAAAQFADHEGQWTVIVRSDNLILAKIQFVIKGESSLSAE